MSIGPAFALYLVGTDPSTNLYVGLALVGFAGLVIALNARYESKWQTLPSSSAYRIKMETRLELDSKDGQAQLCPMSCANVVGPSSGAVSVR